MSHFPIDVSATLHDWQTKFKTATETITNDDTLTLDASLQFAVVSGKVYEFEFYVHYDSVAAADFKFALSGPASPTFLHYFTLGQTPDITATTAQGCAVRVDFDVSISLTHAANTAGFIFGRGICTPSADGTIGFSWAQNTSNGGNTSVLWGSYVKFRRPIS